MHLWNAFRFIPQHQNFPAPQPYESIFAISLSASLCLFVCLYLSLSLSLPLFLCHAVCFFLFVSVCVCMFTHSIACFSGGIKSNNQKGNMIISICSVAQLCPTLCDPMNYSPQGSSVHGILQARILGWVAIPFSGGSSQPRDGTEVS